MARDRNSSGTPPEAVTSIIGLGMKVIGDCETEASVRVDGTVEGSIKAAKAVVIGKEGVVIGDVATQGAVVAGRVSGTLNAESRLELQTTCQVEGEIHTRRMQVEEGAILDGSVHVGSKGSPQAGRSEGEQQIAIASAAQRNNQNPIGSLLQECAGLIRRGVR